MTELYKMRVTPEQKRMLSLASASADSDSMSDFWREYNVYTAELVLKVKAGELTHEQAGELLAEYLSGKVATVEQDEP